MDKKKCEDYLYKVKKPGTFFNWFSGLIGIILLASIPVIVIYFLWYYGL